MASKLKEDLRDMIVTTCTFGGMEAKKAQKLADILLPMIIERVYSHKTTPPPGDNDKEK